MPPAFIWLVSRVYALTPLHPTDVPQMDSHGREVAPVHVSARASTRSRSPGMGKLRSYLTRPVAHGARYLDHGVLAVGLVGGYPDVYRVELALGLLDHVRVGVAAHWLAGEALPRWAPNVALAFWRTRQFEVGAHYFEALYPAPAMDADPTTVSYQQRARYLLASASITQAWFSAGVDLGWARGREHDVFSGDAFVVRDRIAGGLHMRVGTRRLGLLLQASAPYLRAEAVFEVRLGAFELRNKGGWWFPR